MRIQDLSLKVKLGSIFTLALLLNFFGFYVMMNFLDDHKQDSSLINLASSQRMLTMQMVNEAYHVAGGNSAYQAQLQETAKKFEENQGDLIYGNNRSGVHGINMPNIKDHLVEVLHEWQPFSQKLDRLIHLNDPLEKKQIAVEIQQDSALLLKRVSNITNQIEQNSEHKVEIIKNIQMSIMLVNLIIFLFAIWASIHHIIHPITDVIQLMKRVADGDINVKKLTVERRDEVGHLAHSFNHMVSNLKHLVLTGKVQADFLPPEIFNESFEIKTIYKPSEYVSGDFYHYIWDKERNTLYGYLIDVMGHGLDTALHTSHIHVLFEQAAHKHDLSLAEKVIWVNHESIKFLTNETFATGICFEFNFLTSSLKYVSCGINHFIAMTNRQEELITVEGGFLGILETMPFEEYEMSFQSGDYFNFLTDGLLDHLDVVQLNSSSSFQSTYENLVHLSNSTIITDDASALCINIK